MGPLQDDSSGLVSIVVEGPFLIWLKTRGPIQLKARVSFNVNSD